jgi:hypothetical protein
LATAFPGGALLLNDPLVLVVLVAPQPAASNATPARAAERGITRMVCDLLENA